MIGGDRKVHAGDEMCLELKPKIYHEVPCNKHRGLQLTVSLDE